MFADECQNQVSRDRGHLIEARFPELSLDVEFLGETRSPIGLQASIAGLPGSRCREHFGHIGFCAAALASIKQACRFMGHQFRGTHVCIGVGDRKLDTLVSANWAIENLAVAGIIFGSLNEEFAIADAFERYQRAFHVHAVENIPKALSLLADQRACRNLQIVEEQLSCMVVHHRFDRTDGQSVGERCVHVHQEQTQAVSFLFDLVLCCRASQKQEQIGVFGPADPYFLTVDDISVTVAPGEGSD